MDSELVWEHIKAKKDMLMNIPRLIRAKVPGGWLVAAPESGALAFVPDPDYIWT